jgi:hypothetical protein
MAKHRAGVAKRNRGCCLCKPWRSEGNGAANKDARERRDPLLYYRSVGHRLHESNFSGDQAGSISDPEHQ